MTATTLEKPETKIKVDEKKEVGIVTECYGTTILIDPKTGAEYEVELFEKRVKHNLPGGWRRVYLGNFMEILTGLYNNGKKIEVVEFILSNLNSENQLTMTQKEVIKKSKISSQTVVDTYKYLIQNEFMKKVGAVFVINPKYVTAFGSDKKNGAILTKFSEFKPNLFDKDE